MSTDPEFDQIKRRALRVLRMVHELHKRGYQRLRIAPGMSRTGLYWHCAVTHAGNILRTHGAMLGDRDAESARYSSAQGSGYFGWDDAQADSVQQLAAKFLDRFPDVARLGRGRDWPYAGWYVEMMGFAERGAFPMAYADWFAKPGPDHLPTTEPECKDLPMPPGGEAEGEGR